MKRWRRNIRSLKDSNNMVSEIVGTVLLLGITVAIFSSVYAIVLSNQSPPSAIFVNLVGTIEGNNIIIEHRGGEALSLETKVIITIGNKTEKFTVGDKNYLDDEAKIDNQWNVGERLAYPFEYNLSHLYAEIIAIDGESNSLVIIGTLDISPECDIGLKAILYEKIYGGDVVKYLDITATNYRGDINATGVKMKITLPTNGNLTYKGHSATQGNYDNITGIWNVNNLSVGDSVNLEIFVTGGIPSGMGKLCVAELLSLTPRDINPANNKAYLIL